MNSHLDLEEQIFRQASSTFFASAKLFPEAVREDVFRFYSFVRVVDDYVDLRPQRLTDFRAIRQAWEVIKETGELDQSVPILNKISARVIKNIHYTVHKYRCEPAWVDAFFNVMQDDVDGKVYQTLDDTLAYTYGSAEIVGLTMSRIMGLPVEAEPYARLQGRALQYINFIRDIAEDTVLGRCYFPRDDLSRFGLPDLKQTTVEAQLSQFRDFIELQLERYHKWQTEAAAGFQMIPESLRNPLQLASKKYAKLADRVASDPISIYKNQHTEVYVSK